MITKLREILWLFSWLVSLSLTAQIQVSGVVKDDIGEVLPDVVVSNERGEKTYTDLDGIFTIKANKGEKLTFNFYGDTLEKQVEGETMEVQFKANVTDEVVVVAYGEQNREAIVGSVAVVENEVIEKQQATTVTSALQGSVPGVNIITSGGQPGTSPTIRIRGVASINASADPLIVVDGAPYGGNLNAISSDQVESISALKDASSTALYGSRAANGVIIITTKKGRKNRTPMVSLNTKSGISNPAVDLYDMVRVDDFMQYSWEGLKNLYMYGSGYAYSEADASRKASEDLVGYLQYNPYDVPMPVGYDGRIVSTANKLWDADWEDAILNKNASFQEYGLSIDGGSEHTSYYFNINYLDQEGSIKTSEFDRISTRLNLNSQVKDWLNVGLITSFSRSNSGNPTQSGTSYSSPMQWIYSIPSVYPVYARDGAGNYRYDSKGNIYYDYGSGYGNQLMNATRPFFANENGAGVLVNNNNNERRTTYTINGSTKIDLTSNLSFNSNVAFEMYVYDNHFYQSTEVGAAASVDGRVGQDRDITEVLNVVNGLNYKKQWRQHGLKLDLINEIYGYERSPFSAQVTNLFESEQLSGGLEKEYILGYITQKRMLSYLGRAAYDYAGKYFLEGSFRRDGSSIFAPETRWGNFYSIGGAWIVSKENFMESTQSWLNYLKFKSSYGELGNNTIMDVNGAGQIYFPYLSNFDLGWSNGSNIGLLLTGVSDYNLAWEKTSSFNVGVEYGFLKNRISGGVDYYIKESKDLIFGVPKAPSTGITEIVSNAAALKNNGWEFYINTVNVKSDNFEFTTGLNFSFDKNEITNLTQEEVRSGTKLWKVGHSIYDFNLKEYAGVDPNTGKPLWYYDYTDPTTSVVTRELTDDYSKADYYYMGTSSLPDIVGGFTTYLRYKNFDLNALFNFSWGAQVYDSQYASLISNGYRGMQMSTDIANRWQQPGDITNIPMLMASQGIDFDKPSSAFLFDNDYVRLKSLNVGYNIKPEALEKFHISKLRIYFEGDNLWTYQSHEGIDPEQSVAGTTNYRSLSQKIVSMGLNVQF